MTRLPRSSDIVVIGGGIMGASIAWQLARRGVRRVTLLERATIASGASGRTGALLRQHYTNRPEATLAHLSLQVFRNWQDIVGGDCGYVPQGLIVTVDTGPGSEGNLELLHHNVAMQRSIGIDSVVISPSDLLELQPFARVDDLAAAAYERESGYVDSISATRLMALAAIREKAELLEAREAIGIDVDGNQVVGVRTTDGTILTRTVVCATGPWSLPLLSPIGLSVPITALRVQVAIVQRPLELAFDHFVYIDTAAGMFCRPWGPGRSLIGVGGGDQHDEVNPWNYEQRNDPTYPSTAIAAASKRIPAMAGASYLHGHAGLYDMTPDAHPIIGPAGPDGLYLALGFSGAGFKKGPAVGQCLAEQILDGESRTVDLSPFLLSRFDTVDWQRPWSTTEYAFTSDFGHRL